jgi:hypothetical protein
LLAQAAQEEGLDKTPDFIMRQRRMNEDLLISMLSQKRADTIKLPAAAEVDKFIAENPAMFGNRSILSLDQLVFDPPKDLSVLKRLEQDHSLESVARSLNELRIPFQRGQAKLDTAGLAPPIARQILALPRSEPFILPSGGKFYVSVVTAAQAVQTSPDQARKLAAQAMQRQNLASLMNNRLKELRARAKISYQSGFEPPAAEKEPPKS